MLGNQVAILGKKAIKKTNIINIIQYGIDPKKILPKVASGLYVEFENKQSAITEGQFVAWYNNDELLGSGVIS